MVKSRAMMKRRNRLLSALRLRRTTTVSLHERFTQVLQNQLNVGGGRRPRLHRARSHLKRTGLWTRLGWLKVTQRLCGFWSFKNKYGWRARFNRRGVHTRGQHRFLKTRNLKPQTAGPAGHGWQVGSRTFLSAAGRSDREAGLGPRRVMMTGPMLSLAPAPAQSEPELFGLHGSLTPSWSVPGPQSGGASASRAWIRWKSPVPTKSQLDAELDDYMSMMPARLDAELDEYMSMMPARLDAELDEYMSMMPARLDKELDEYMCQSGQSLLD
ncbi:uncharacterized protein LOC128772102 isoform X2 [Synchiropus splendidus]|uniref:uncharacterized protein LOC128772102 isoform X2 n=1 Tax=Synchiropus splendidus TaxID=270530 RepID=UPI00237DF2D1|nr:uncharacterized protein LOC128772102 isoform X2 [Synchiropus splendidus]